MTDLLLTRLGERAEVPQNDTNGFGNAGVTDQDKVAA
jgi:hypothetical protein